MLSLPPAKRRAAGLSRVGLDHRTAAVAREHGALLVQEQPSQFDQSFFNLFVFEGDGIMPPAFQAATIDAEVLERWESWTNVLFVRARFGRSVEPMVIASNATIVALGLDANAPVLPAGPPRPASASPAPHPVISAHPAIASTLRLVALDNGTMNTAERSSFLTQENPSPECLSLFTVFVLESATGAIPPGFQRVYVEAAMLERWEHWPNVWFLETRVGRNIAPILITPQRIIPPAVSSASSAPASLASLLPPPMHQQQPPTPPVPKNLPAPMPKNRPPPPPASSSSSAAVKYQAPPPAASRSPPRPPPAVAAVKNRPPPPKSLMAKHAAELTVPLPRLRPTVRVQPAVIELGDTEDDETRDDDDDEDSTTEDSGSGVDTATAPTVVVAKRKRRSRKQGKRASDRVPLAGERLAHRMVSLGPHKTLVPVVTEPVCLADVPRMSVDPVTWEHSAVRAYNSIIELESRIESVGWGAVEDAVPEAAKQFRAEVRYRRTVMSLIRAEQDLSAKREILERNPFHNLQSIANVVKGRVVALEGSK